jgi:putative DNA methylase
LLVRNWKGAQGLAEDVRHYGRWMRAEAEKRIGNLYPKIELPDGSNATVIAWLWARTVRSPDPAAKGAHVPLAPTFLLSTKQGKKAWVVPIVDRASATYQFDVRSGTPTADEEAKAKTGTKSSRGANFVCVISGSPIEGDWIKAEGKAGRMGVRLMAVVAESQRGRVS